MQPRLILILAKYSGQLAEKVVEYVGLDWYQDENNPDLWIKGEPAPIHFFDEDSADEADEDHTYPDIGIHIQKSIGQPDIVEIGTLGGFWDPTLNYEVEPVATIASDEHDFMEKLQVALEKTREKAQSRLSTCKFCNKNFPPTMISLDDGYCFGCGSDHIGVLY